MSNSTEVARIDVAQLGILNELGDAGQGKVFRVTVPYVAQPMAYKEYSRHFAAAVDWSTLEDLIGVYGRGDEQLRAWLWQHTGWPTTMVTRLGERTGFLTPLAPPECTIPLHIGGVSQPTLLGLDHLLNPPEYMVTTGLSVTLRHRVELLRELAAVMARLHGIDVVIGDLSPKIVVVSLWPRSSCFLLDCDAVRKGGTSVLAQVESPGWELPAGEELATRTGDSFKLALCVLRVLASNRTTRDLSLLPSSLPELTALVTRTLAAVPHERPGAGEWLAVLDRAIAWASAPPVLPSIPVSIPPQAVPVHPVAPGPVGPGSAWPGAAAAPWPVAAPTRPPRSPGQIWTVALVALVVVLLLGGGGVAIAYRLSHGSTDAAQADDTTGPDTGPAPAPTPISTPTTPSTSDSLNVTPSATRASPSATFGVVDYTDVALDPNGPDVARLFDRYFTAINVRDFPTVLGTYDPASEIGQSTPDALAQFEAGISTSTDSHVQLVALGTGTGNIAITAQVTFESAQAAGKGPARNPNETCTRWDITYSLTAPSPGEYLIFAGKVNTNAPC